MEKILPQNIQELTKKYSTSHPMNQWSGAVNLLLVANKVAFIKRSDQMPSHKGQIGFFGGHKQQDESVIDTALRETFEESSLQKELFEVLGLVEPVYTSSGRLIIPVVSRYLASEKDFLHQAKSNGEWSDLILVDLSYLENIDHWQYAQVTRKQIKYPVYFCPLNQDVYLKHTNNENHEFMLWGASAKMLWNFFKI